MSDVRPGDLVRVIRCSVAYLAGLADREGPVMAYGDRALVVSLASDDLSVLLLTTQGALGWMIRTHKHSFTTWVERV